MAACKYCKDEIQWEQEGGKWKAYNPAGSAHWCDHGAHVTRGTAQSTMVIDANPPWVEDVEMPTGSGETVMAQALMELTQAIRELRETLATRWPA